MESVFIDKTDPAYRPNYGMTYTQRQKMIMNEELPLDEVSNTDLVKLIRKAEDMEDMETAKIVRGLHATKNYADTYHFTILRKRRRKSCNR